MNLVAVRPVQNSRRQESRRLQRVPANHVEDQEPHGDDHGADNSGDRSVDDDPRPRVFHIPRRAIFRFSPAPASQLNLVSSPLLTHKIRARQASRAGADYPKFGRAADSVPPAPPPLSALPNRLPFNEPLSDE